MAILTSPPNSVRADSESGTAWRQALRTAVRDPVELCRRLQLPADCESAATRASRGFPVFVPLGYIARMEPGNPRDPLLRQVLPLDDELSDTLGFTADPVGDLAAQRATGLLHKYHGRALMITTGTCAVHCRYCFRRQYPYDQSPSSGARWTAAAAEIARDPSLEEIILSGGDPLTLGDAPLSGLAQMLSTHPPSPPPAAPYPAADRHSGAGDGRVVGLASRHASDTRHGGPRESSPRIGRGR